MKGNIVNFPSREDTQDASLHPGLVSNVVDRFQLR